jgi:hypothetical protein
MDRRYEAARLAALADRSPGRLPVPTRPRPHVGNAFKDELVDVFVDGPRSRAWGKNHPIKTVARLRTGPLRREAPPA